MRSNHDRNPRNAVFFFGDDLPPPTSRALLAFLQPADRLRHTHCGGRRASAVITWLLVAHVIVIGYWLGAELVINSHYRLVCFANEMPFGQRSRLMDHVMQVDQHVRYALVLQLILGAMLSVRIGYAPGGSNAAILIAALGVVWLVFIEAVHRLRTGALGNQLASIDRASRYVLLVALAATGSGLLFADWPLPTWLRWKLLLFAAIVCCGVAVRLALLAHFRTWAEMAASGSTSARESAIRRTYRRATSILLLLWLLIAGIVFLSVTRPG